MAPPLAKKRRLVAPAAVVTRRTTRSQKPRLSAELLGKVGTYSALGRDLLGLCVVAGPKDCGAIRHAYLRNNFDYLQETIRSYTGVETGELRSDRDWKTCRARYRAWMAVNTDWRKYVTDEYVEIFERAVSGIEGEEVFAVKFHSFVPLCNPAVAIELGLDEVLVHLVEEKGIDVNSYRWNNYQYVLADRAPCHLLVKCMRCRNIEAFRYLLGWRDIDIHSNFDATNDDWRILDAALYMGCCADFFRELLAHPSFDMVASYHGNSSLHIAIDFLNMDDFLDVVPLPTWKAKFRLLLSAGADPYMEVDGMDAIQFASKLLRETRPLRVGKLWKDLDSNLQSKISGLGDAVEILEDWVAIK